VYVQVEVMCVVCGRVVRRCVPVRGHRYLHARRYLGSLGLIPSGAVIVPYNIPTHTDSLIHL
jgi:hypothetical protein